MADNHAAATVAIVQRPEPRAGMSPVVEMGMEMLRLNPDPNTLRELLAVQREWEAGENKKAYAAAMVALKRDLPTVIARDSVVDFTSAKGRTFYKHASLAGAIAAVTDPLTQHGFSLSWKSGNGPNGITVVCCLTHCSGHCEESPPLTAPPDTSGSKNSAQAIASTITLLQRYSALALLGIATADMQEPKGEEEKPVDLARIDIERNMALVGWLKKHHNISREQAEEQLEGKPVANWTEGDVQALATWARAPRTSEQPPSE